MRESTGKPRGMRMSRTQILACELMRLRAKEKNHTRSYRDLVDAQAIVRYLRRQPRETPF